MCILVEAIGQQHDPKEWYSGSWVLKICCSIMKINTFQSEGSYDDVNPEENSKRLHFSVVHNHAAQNSVHSSANGKAEHGKSITQRTDDHVKNHWF
jgi:hypothetical protein